MKNIKITRRQLLKAGSAGAAALFLQNRLFPLLTVEEIAYAMPHRDMQKVDDEGLNALLSHPTAQIPVDLKALFMGPKAENSEEMEKLLLRVFRDYVYWRRNFHPEDALAITPEDQYKNEYRRLMAHFERELFTLLGELKSDIPFYSPRYIGHMTADTSLPGLIGYIATMLYNPNNVSWEASPVTTLLEVEVGRELAWMLGFGTNRAELVNTWGHITSGGTLANIESIWVAKALKFLPLAVRFAADELGITGITAGGTGKPLHKMTAWELVNLTPKEALDLKDLLISSYVKATPTLTPQDAMDEVLKRLKAHDILTLGDYAFFSRLKGKDAMGSPMMCIPQTMHYSWVKGPGAIGIGSGQVDRIPIDNNYRMDVNRLKESLEKAHKERRPVVEVVGVLGTTEEGAVDPMYEIVALREEMRKRGMSFLLHCDAAYGGYMASCFKKRSGKFRTISDMRKEYGGWPSQHVYKSFVALAKADSATVDPHKLGFAPYPAGAVVFRDGRCKELVAQEAAYALGGREPRKPGEIYIGKYILEGSKPGAAAASVFLSHRVIPTDERGYGRLLGKTALVGRVFHKRLEEFADAVKDEFTVVPLAIPDTNIVDYLFNIAGNTRLDVMNRFSMALYNELSIDPAKPVQTRRFIVSHTEFDYDNYNPAVIRPLLSKIGIRKEDFVSPHELIELKKQGKRGSDSEVVVFRTTLMNAYTLDTVRGSTDYLGLFLRELPTYLRNAKSSFERERKE